jgi:hypothetical protein
VWLNKLTATDKKNFWLLVVCKNYFEYFGGFDQSGKVWNNVKK